MCHYRCSHFWMPPISAKRSSSLVVPRHWSLPEHAVVLPGLGVLVFSRSITTSWQDSRSACFGRGPRSAEDLRKCTGPCQPILVRAVSSTGGSPPCKGMDVESKSKHRRSLARCLCLCLSLALVLSLSLSLSLVSCLSVCVSAPSLRLKAKVTNIHALAFAPFWPAGDSKLGVRAAKPGGSMRTRGAIGLQKKCPPGWSGRVNLKPQ